eukprot:380853-Pyramimonas_sp.AAC.1
MEAPIGWDIGSSVSETSMSRNMYAYLLRCFNGRNHLRRSSAGRIRHRPIEESAWLGPPRTNDGGLFGRRPC